MEARESTLNKTRLWGYNSETFHIDRNLMQTKGNYTVKEGENIEG